jgi:hypothetical protein
LEVPQYKIDEFFTNIDFKDVTTCDNNLKKGIKGERMDIYSKILGMQIKSKAQFPDDEI